MNLGRERLSVGGGVLLGFLLVVLTPPFAYTQQAPTGASPSGPGAQAPSTGPDSRPRTGPPQPEGKPSEEAPPAPPEYQPPPPSVQFPLLPPAEVVPATPETPLKPIPFGLAPPLLTEGKRFWLQLSIGMQEEFTDNVNQTNTNRQSQWSTSITPGIQLGIDSPRTRLSLAYFPSFTFSNNQIEFDPNQYLTLQWSWPASPYIRLDLSDTFTYSDDYLAFGDIGTLRTGSNPTLANTASTGISYAPTWGSLGVNYTNTINRTYDVQNPDDSLIQSGGISAQIVGPKLSVGGSYTVTRGSYDISSDYWAQTVRLNAQHPVSPTINASLLGSVTYHSPDLSIAVEYIVANVGVIGSWRYSPTASLELGAGIGIFSPQENAFPGLQPLLAADSTTQVRPDLLFRWSQEFLSFVISAQYTQLYVPDFGSPQFFNVSFRRTAGLSLTTPGTLFRNLRGTLAVNWVQSEYPLTTINVAAGTTQNTFNVNFSAGYNIFGGLSLNFLYDFITRDSSTPSQDFYENRFQIGLNYAYNVF